MRKHPGSDIDNFKKAVELTSRLLADVKEGVFYSPYSVHPIISQILGLNAPLMGSGDSPYSIISVISEINEKKAFKDAFDMPLAEKRLITDDIYEMIAPVILGEEERFIEGELNIRHKESTDGFTPAEIKEFDGILREKFTVLKEFFNSFKYKKGQFAQIVHYGNIDDLSREYDFIHSLPGDVSEQWFDLSYPRVSEILIRNFPDNGTNTKKDIAGWIIFISNSTKQLIESSKLRKEKILQAARLAEKLGADIVGMAGLIASFAQGGHWLSEHIPTVGFTTGHAFTIANIMGIMKKCARKVGLDVKRSTVAVVGAGGSIGSGCAELIVKEKPANLILIDISSFVGQKKLKETEDRLKDLIPASQLSVSTDLSDIKKADIIICATNSLTSIIRSEHLKPGAIVIDDSFPKNISEGLLDKRDDVVFLGGGITQLPTTIDIHVSRNMPDLMDIPITRAFSCKEVYGCLAEVLILSLFGHKGNYGLGYANSKLAEDIARKSRRINVSIAPLQCFDRVVEEERFQKVLQFYK